MTTTPSETFADTIAADLPYLRRYARALTGSQASGDAFASATLEAILVDATAVLAARDPRVGLFAAFHKVWSSAGTPLGPPDTRLSARAQALMADLTPNAREALLLHSIEGFGVDAIAAIMDTDRADVTHLIETAQAEMADGIRGPVLIIEDEAIIAMDIRSIVEDLGHTVTGVARTRDEAVRLARRDGPRLVLADIQLADRSSGIDAVHDILADLGDIPVVFITAFPERLLTGTRPEPAFMITKPYTEDQVRSAVSQAMFFASTETLGV